MPQRWTGTDSMKSRDKEERHKRHKEILIVVIVDEMPLKSASTQIPCIVFLGIVGNIASLRIEAQARKPKPALSHSFRTRSLPGAFLISHCRHHRSDILFCKNRATPTMRSHLDLPRPYIPIHYEYYITNISVV